MLNSPLLPLHFRDPMFQIMNLKLPHVHRGDEKWCVGEEVIHLFEGTFLGFGLDGPYLIISISILYPFRRSFSINLQKNSAFVKLHTTKTM